MPFVVELEGPKFKKLYKFLAFLASYILSSGGVFMSSLSIINIIITRMSLFFFLPLERTCGRVCPGSGTGVRGLPVQPV